MAIGSNEVNDRLLEAFEQGTNLIKEVMTKIGLDTAERGSLTNPAGGRQLNIFIFIYYKQNACHCCVMGTNSLKDPLREFIVLCLQTNRNSDMTVLMNDTSVSPWPKQSSWVLAVVATVD